MPDNRVSSQVLIYPRMENNRNKLSTKQGMSRPLLNANYVMYQTESAKRLLPKAEIFKVCIFGYNDTVVKTSIINTLYLFCWKSQTCVGCCWLFLPCNEGWKERCILCEMKMMPYMRELDPMKDLFDMIAIDWAYNEKKARTLMKQHFLHYPVIKAW
jgi:hypothetical protein